MNEREPPETLPESDEPPEDIWTRHNASAPKPLEPPYPGPLSATLLTLGAFAALIFVTSLFVSLSFAASIGIGQAIGIGAVATLAARRVAEPRAERLGLQGFSQKFFTPLLLLLPATLLLSEIDNALAVFFPPPQLSPAEEEILVAVDFDSFYGRIQLAIILVGIKPVIEEWLFRGVIQQGLIEHMGRVRGIALTAILFAPIYAALARTGASFASALSIAFCAGALFGIVRLATSSVLASTLLSGGFNAIALAGSWLEDTLPIAGYNAPGEHTPAFWLIIAAICVGLGLRPLLRIAAVMPVAIPRPDPSRANSSSRE